MDARDKKRILRLQKTVGNVLREVAYANAVCDTAKDPLFSNEIGDALKGIEKAAEVLEGIVDIDTGP